MKDQSPSVSFATDFTVLEIFEFRDGKLAQRLSEPSTEGTRHNLIHWDNVTLGFEGTEKKTKRLWLDLSNQRRRLQQVDHSVGQTLFAQHDVEVAA